MDELLGSGLKGDELPVITRPGDQMSGDRAN